MGRRPALWLSNPAAVKLGLSQRFSTIRADLVCKQRVVSCITQCFADLNKTQRPSFHASAYVFKKNRAARRGQHLAKLDDMAHDRSRKEATERRRKKKEKKAERASKRSQSSTTAKVSDEGEDLDTGADTDDETKLADPKDVAFEMDAMIAAFVDSLKGIRGADPTVEMFDDIKVDAYGATNTPLSAVAQVEIVSPVLATATCFDPTLGKAVKDAILQQLEGLNPSVEDAVVKIPLPRASLETRQQTAAALTKRAESIRQRLRTVRRKHMNTIKAGVAGKLAGVSKDDAFRVQQQVEDVTEKAILKVNQVVDAKHEQILKV